MALNHTSSILDFCSAHRTQTWLH